MPDLVQSFSSNINKFYIVPIITRLFSLCIKSNHYNTLVRFTERRSEFSKVYSAISSAVAKDVHLNNLGQWKLNDRFTKNLSADFLLIEAHLSFSQGELMKPTMRRLLGITSTDWLPDFLPIAKRFAGPLLKHLGSSSLLEIRRACSYHRTVFPSTLSVTSLSLPQRSQRSMKTTIFSQHMTP